MYSNAAGVLTRADIHKIRHYVHHKHGDLPTERRAEIVADAMQRIVLRQLPEFPEEQKQTVMRTVLRDVVAGRGMPVNDSFIFEACVKLDDAGEPELLEALHVWAEKRLGTVIAPDLFREAVAEGRRIASAPEIGVTAWDAVIGTVGLQDPGRIAGSSSLGIEGTLASLGANRTRTKPGVYLAMSVALCLAMLGYGWWTLRPAPVAIERSPVVTRVSVQAPPVVKLKNALPEHLRYAEVDRQRLVRYLRTKSSLLAEEPYLSAIIKAAKDHDIHPLLMFAITGQEQGFVPKTAKNAAKIANNPFNVFYSWKSFNTTIDESARIAGNTINRLSFERPDDVDPVKWINREYAEDTNWSDGVNSLFKAMIAQITTDK
ncbi:glucosaminidase domain-containing protein [Paenibacillus glycinis]|uniref:Mannosyl-glycoprotein endo-beta-N-acetylglucosamidase-like domain-containing protein n=1 Tax=Paenibacillus glycinis TaxID=2697035 RepID=A0ABW9XLK3_9BACL|nr:glucosaminidase domain-containing protein [Paenibacillus glycinis]NBD23451.1 hypothetical protein [Paenibacillus glycinis]